MLQVLNVLNLNSEFICSMTSIFSDLCHFHDLLNSAHECVSSYIALFGYMIPDPSAYQNGYGERICTNRSDAACSDQSCLIDSRSNDNVSEVTVPE